MLKARRSDRPPATNKPIKKSNTIKNNYNSKLSFAKKYIIYIFLSLIILFIGFTVLVPMLVNLKVWKPEIKAMLEAETGKFADIKGDIELSLYPSPQIKIYGISLKDDQKGVLIDFFNSDSVIAKLSLWTLLKGKIVIDKIIFEDLTINLENYPGADPNWVFYKKENKLELDKEAYNEVNSKFNYIQYPNVKIYKYEITKGNIIYNKDLKINIKDFLITKNNDADIIKGYLNINGINFSLNSSFVKQNDVENLWKSSLSLINKDLKILTNGDFKYKNNYPSLEGDLEISSDNIGKLFKGYKDINILNDKLKLTSKLSLSFENNNLLYSIYNLSANSGPFKFTGIVSGNNGIEPTIDAILSSNSMDLDLVNGSILSFKNILLKSKDQKFKNIKSYWDLFEGNMLLTVGTSKFLDYPIRDLIIDIEKKDKKYTLNSGKGTFPGNTKISLKGDFKNNFSLFEGSSIINSEDIRQFSKWLSIDIKNISDSRLKKTKLMSNVVLRDGGASFIGINGKIDSSEVTGEVRLRYEDLNSLYANLKVDKINLDAYIEKNSLSEEITKPNILNILTFDEINIDVNFDKLLFAKNEYNKIKFSGISKNDVLNIDELNILNFHNGKLILTGNIDYSSKDIRYDLAIKINHKNFEQFYNSYNLPIYLEDIFLGKGTIEILAKGKSDFLYTNMILDTDRLNILYDGDLNIKNMNLIGYDGKINISINDLNKFLTIPSKNNIIDKSNFFSNIFLKDNKLNINNIDFKSANYEYKGDIDINYDENKSINFYADLFSKATSINNLISIYNYFYLDKKNNIKGELKLKADSFNIYNVKISNFNSFVKFSEEELHLKKLEGNLFNGSISAEGKRSNNKEYAYKGNIKLSKIDSNILINDYFSYNKIKGDINSKIEVSGKAINIDQFFKTLNAKVEASIKKPKLLGLDTSKLIGKRSFKSELDINEFILESFNTEEKAEINNFSIKFNINDSSLILEKVNLKINNLNTWLEGKFNFYNKNYNASFKISLNDIDDKFILLNLKNDKGVENISIKNNYYLNNNIAANDSKKELDNEVNIISEKNNNDDFDTILDDLSKNSILSNLNKEDLSEIKDANVIKTASPQSSTVKDTEEDKSFNKVIESNIKISKLPTYLKDIKQPLPINYFKPKIIVNTITKPKLPSEEDLLDNLLESVLNP